MPGPKGAKPHHSFERRTELHNKAADGFRAGEGFAAKGEHNAARIEYKKSAGIWKDLAEHAHNAGEMEEAEDHKKKAVIAMNQQGIAHRNLGETEEARNTFENALEINPNSIQVLGNFANLLEHTNEDKAALEKYDLALKNLGWDENFRDSQKGKRVGVDWAVLSSLMVKARGRVHDRLGNDERALNDLENASSLLHDLGKKIENDGDKQGADHFFGQSEELKPHISELINTVTEKKLETMSDEEALKSFEEAITLNVQNIDAQANYLKALRKLGRHDDAQDHVDYLRNTHRIHMR